MMRPVVGASPPSIPNSADAVNPVAVRGVPQEPPVDPTVLKAAQGMEAMFLDYMMKVMRQTVPKNDLDLENPATEIYRSMLDTEMADRAAHTVGVGLAEQIIAYLNSTQYNQMRRSAGYRASQSRKNAVDPDGRQGTGGTHEGQSHE